MRVAVEKLDGVDKAEVSLDDGRVTVRLAPGNAVTIAELRRTIRHQGFTPKEAKLTLSARIEVRGPGAFRQRYIRLPRELGLRSCFEYLHKLKPEPRFILNESGSG